jgi:serine phosphatase RsbU (regulator of sigma subunit)
VGGDWYDCIAFRDGRVALVIGDVMGKGLRAAAVMGQVRTAVRSVAAANPAPVAVLTALDEVALDLDADEIVTLTYVLLDLPAGRAQVAPAGHLPPVVVDAAGRAAVVYDGGSTPLGTPDPDRVEASLPLGPGSTLVLFTDGVVEQREQAITDGLDLLVDTVAAASRDLHQDPQGTVERLVAHADGEDDMALLVAAVR